MNGKNVVVLVNEKGLKLYSDEKLTNLLSEWDYRTGDGFVYKNGNEVKYKGFNEWYNGLSLLNIEFDIYIHYILKKIGGLF